jgi:GAF domain-containing protein
LLTPAQVVSLPSEPSKADHTWVGGPPITDGHSRIRLLNVPLPRSEKRRLATLRLANILDTRPEMFSESVAAAAATIANTPMSAISLIDSDRQWFKGSFGLALRETSRDVSLCAHAILQPAPLVVPDTRLDVRFNTNPLVTGAPHIRFYAGFPLLVNGHAVGSLCVIDDRPRQSFEADAEKLARLMDLAVATSAWLANYDRTSR